MRFRLRSLVQVNTRSPMPERPERVWGSAPIRTARRVTSASPRVINAARALYPHPSPSLTPAAMAITFFTAPPTSTPTTSEVVYTRNLEEEKTLCTLAATVSVVAAAVTAVGRPHATSAAKLGPDNTTTRALRGSPSTSASTALMVCKVSSSIPLVVLTISGTLCKEDAIALVTARIAWEGTASTTSSASVTAWASKDV